MFSFTLGGSILRPIKPKYEGTVKEWKISKRSRGLVRYSKIWAIPKDTIAAGRCHTVGLKSDGTVTAVGDNKYGQCDVNG